MCDKVEEDEDGSTRSVWILSYYDFQIVNNRWQMVIMINRIWAAVWALLLYLDI